MHNYFKDASMLKLWEIMIIIFMSWPITDKLQRKIFFSKKTKQIIIKIKNKVKF